jgi:predicted NACHT family NTPase
MVVVARSQPPRRLDNVGLLIEGLRSDFAERLEEFLRGLPSEVAVIVTCRTREYKEVLATHPGGLVVITHGVRVLYAPQTSDTHPLAGSRG